MNELSETLREQRLGALEATNLLRTVMAEIDVAVFTFDDNQRLRLVNREGERLLNQPSGAAAWTHGCGIRSGTLPRWAVQDLVPMEFPGGSGRWGVRVSSFREHGRPHQVLLLSDLTRPLRAEEVQAWKRLVRVLGHELNNSLTPIKSIASSLKTLVDREPLPHDWRQDVDDGLSVISGRAEALARFMSSYARLARLPEPKPGTVEVDQWVRRIAELEQQNEGGAAPGPPLDDSGRRRSTGPVADQPHAQCRRRGPGNGGRSTGRLAPCRFATGSVGRRRGARPGEHRQTCLFRSSPPSLVGPASAWR